MPEMIFGEVERSFEQNQLQEISREILSAAKGLNVWLLEGEMGSGKTTLVKTVAKELGVKETVSSPTFSIMNEYSTKMGASIFHFDFYRIKSETEAYDIGANEYLESDHLCLVEWPEKIPTLIPPHYFKIKLEIIDSTSRTIHYARH